MFRKYLIKISGFFLSVINVHEHRKYNVCDNLTPETERGGGIL